MKHPISPDTSGLYEKIWNFVREQLSVRYPFFRHLLWNFSFQESSETSSAGTDGSVIYFCPDFLDKNVYRMIPILWKRLFFAYAVSLSFPSSDPGDTFWKLSAGIRPATLLYIDDPS